MVIAQRYLVWIVKIDMYVQENDSLFYSVRLIGVDQYVQSRGKRKLSVLKQKS